MHILPSEKKTGAQTGLVRGKYPPTAHEPTLEIKLFYCFIHYQLSLLVITFPYTNSVNISYIFKEF